MACVTTVFETMYPNKLLASQLLDSEQETASQQLNPGSRIFLPKIRHTGHIQKLFSNFRANFKKKNACSRMRIAHVYPHGGVRPFHQKSTSLTQSTLGPCVVQIWSSNTLDLRGNETLVLHRVVATTKREFEKERERDAPFKRPNLGSDPCNEKACSRG